MSSVSTILDKTSSTKSVILFVMKMAPRELIDWLNAEMDNRNWGIRETAQRVGVSHPTISDIVTNGKQPSFDTVLALAKTFNKSPISLLVLSGLLSADNGFSHQIEDMKAIFKELPIEDQEEIIQIAKMKLEAKNKSSPPGRVPAPRPKHDKAGENSALLIKSES